MKKIGIGKSGSARQKQRKTVVMLIYVTIILIVLALSALLIAQVVKPKAPDTTPQDGEGTNTNAGYVPETVTKADINSGSLILVNRDHQYVFEGKSVVAFPSTGRVYGLRDGSLRADSQALTAFDTMMNDLYKNVSSANVVVITAYRSFEAQEALANGTPGGFSDFHTGMSFEMRDATDGNYVDINDASLNGKYDWLYENAHKYGFIVRYPDNVPADSTAKNAGKNYSNITGVEDFANVFRYVGPAHATYMYNNYLCLEEYIELLRTTYKYGVDTLTVKAADGKTYEVYYFDSTGDTTEIQVPVKYSYEVSGNNVNGYIVTVCKSTKK
ncbi:MAG: D-alanyl-D-alanine carboxypeptidase family protein [Ruminococcaceae bacterium]|nr:D-alanyl-D-alanine carboxypeptidase family protein [Oscillospiraceae bacterium]